MSISDFHKFLVNNNIKCSVLTFAVTIICVQLFTVSHKLCILKLLCDTCLWDIGSYHRRLYCCACRH